ncbi:hypothetical protein F0344_04740 [Streptomyces finlayi]|uniref:Tail assembly chaperone n=1 Tax=Streptomyces finlayi TaxID=67296 RepID=A0A7G7BF84_9ACTN|nr:hypothetical protein [Streptomyces finlayi]QNE73999.1 hypothetical protein F0344_04740 [Streptomyces finlayi]
MPAKKPVKTASTEMPNVLDLKLDSLTIGEICAIEDITGQPLDSLNKAGAKRGPMLKAMAYIVMKRKNPDFTVADADNLQIEFKGKSPADPTAANA